MEPDRAIPHAAASPSSQRLARIALATGVVAVGLWILFDFLPALVWAAVLAIALWPLYRHLLRQLPEHSDRVLGPLLATIGIGIVFIAPLVLLGVALAQESHVMDSSPRRATTAFPCPNGSGSCLPGWPDDCPMVAHQSERPGHGQELIGRVDLHTLTKSAREFGGEVVHRLAIFLFTLLTLFFCSVTAVR